MIWRLVKAALVSSLVVLLPAAGHAAGLHMPHLWILWAFGVLGSILQPEYNPFTIGAQPGDRGTGAQIIWSVYATQVAAVMECVYVRDPGSVTWGGGSVAAVMAMAVGLALRTWAVATLGPLFTMNIAVQENHELIRRGPYRIVRHPSYLGAFVLYLSSTLLLHAWYSAAVAVPVLLFAFLRRISYEEALLRDQFGLEYEAYSANVKRLLPGIW